MHKLPAFSAVIFDMDGLVLDTEITYFIAWQQAAETMGYQFSDKFCFSLSGMHSQGVELALAEYCGKDFDLMQFGKLSAKYWREYTKKKGIPVKKGFFTLLSLLKRQKIPYCLATNSSKQNALECLALGQLSDVFSIIISKDDVLQGKPAPDIFLYAANCLKIPASQCLVIEDSATGIQAAVNAKTPSILVPSVLPADKVAVSQADYLVNDLDELAQIILKSYVHPV